jgi:hypothetical protein
MLFLLSCSKTNTFIHCTDWVGDYAFHEDPVPTATGINKIMEWELSVSQNSDTCFGTLEITGLTTYIKLLTTLSGDSARVDVVYNKYLDHRILNRVTCCSVCIKTAVRSSQPGIN